MLFVNNFYHNASEEQCRRYLDKVISGESMADVVMTEPVGRDRCVGDEDASSAARGIPTLSTGERFSSPTARIDDKTLGNIFLVYARTEKGLSSFLVEKGFRGFRSGNGLHGKAGMRASMTAELVFEDCVVPVENRLGEEGESTIHMMRNLRNERVTIAAGDVPPV